MDINIKVHLDSLKRALYRIRAANIEKYFQNKKTGKISKDISDLVESNTREALPGERYRGAVADPSIKRRLPAAVRPPRPAGIACCSVITPWGNPSPRKIKVSTADGQVSQEITLYTPGDGPFYTPDDVINSGEGWYLSQSGFTFFDITLANGQTGFLRRTVSFEKDERDNITQLTEQYRQPQPSLQHFTYVYALPVDSKSQIVIVGDVELLQNKSRTIQDEFTGEYDGADALIAFTRSFSQFDDTSGVATQRAVKCVFVSESEVREVPTPASILNWFDEVQPTAIGSLVEDPFSRTVEYEISNGVFDTFTYYYGTPYFFTVYNDYSTIHLRSFGLAKMTEVTYWQYADFVQSSPMFYQYLKLTNQERESLYNSGISINPQSLKQYYSGQLPMPSFYYNSCTALGYCSISATSNGSGTDYLNVISWQSTRLLSDGAGWLNPTTFRSEQKTRKEFVFSVLTDTEKGYQVSSWDWGKPGHCRQELLALGFAPEDLM